MENNLINELKEAISNIRSLPNLSNELTKAFNDSQNEIESNFVNLVFLGNFNAGKTSMINAIIANSTNNFENVKLPTSRSENTYYPTIIQCSPDNLYHLEISRKNVIENSTTYKTAEKINDILDSYDEVSSDYLEIINQLETETDENIKCELEKKIPELIVRIKVPNFLKNIRLVDCPGLTSTTIKDRFFKLLEQKFLFSIFIYLKSMVQEQVIDKVNIEVFKRIRKEHANSIFCICLTKYDIFLTDFLEGSDFLNKSSEKKTSREKTKEASKFGLKISQFFTRLSDISNRENDNYINISNIFFINSGGAIDQKNSNAKKQILLFIEIVEKIKNEKGKFIKWKSLINRMRNKIEEINSYYSKEKLMTDQEIDTFGLQSELTSFYFKENIKKWEFPKEYEEFDKVKKEKINKIKKLFIDNEKNPDLLGNKKFYVRDNYLNEQFKLLSSDLIKMVQEDIQEIIIRSIEMFIKDLPLTLINKLKDMLIEKGCYKESDSTSEIFGASLSGLALGLAISLTVKGGVEFAANSFIIAYGFVWFPAIGWIIGAALGSYTFASSIENYVGTYSRIDCFDELMKAFFYQVSNKLDEIKTKCIGNYYEIITTFKSEILMKKKTIAEIKVLYQILNKYMHFSNSENYIEMSKLIDIAKTNLIEEEKNKVALIEFLNQI